MIVDYLQLLRTVERYHSREQQVGYISSSLKELARKMECPVIALCQLNREVEATKTKRPLLSHLRESGSIEADADSVVLIYRPEYYYRLEKKPTPPGEEGLVELSIAKQRNRETGVITARWDHSDGSWTNWSLPTYKTSVKNDAWWDDE